MPFIAKTDLATERLRADLSLPGVKRTTAAFGNVTEERLTVTDDCGASSIEKPKGCYITLSFPSLGEDDENAVVLTERLSEILSETVKRLTRKESVADCNITVVGLGNRAITADAIGVTVAEKVRATAHLKTEEPKIFKQLACASITVLAPGVLANSGMEAADRVKAVVSLVNPDVIIAVDALAARSYERVLHTVQIADSGLMPGSGIGNRRKALSRETLGVPVISVGVPTVCDTLTFVRDALTLLPEEELPANLASLTSSESNSFVARGDCDILMRRLSDVIGDAVNRTFGIFF